MFEGEETTVAAQDTTIAGAEDQGTQEEEQGTLATQQEGEEQNEAGATDDGDDDGKSGDDDKKGEVPETYDLKPPEGMELDATMLETFTPVFKEMGLTQEQAQKLADAYAPLAQSQAEEARKASLDSFKEIVEGWKNDTMKDLGTNAQKELAFVAKARKQFGNDAFAEMLNETGVGNHPEMVKFLVAVGKVISSDQFPDSSTITGTNKNPTDVLYPSMDK